MGKSPENIPGAAQPSSAGQADTATQDSAPVKPASLAVIVVSYNVRDLLRSCLRATFASLEQATELDATVWVVDNASSDGSAVMVAEEFPQVRLIPSPANLGFSGGNNLALKALGFRDLGRPQNPGIDMMAEDGEAFSVEPGFWERMGLAGPKPDLVLLLNPDTEPLENAIGQMAGFLMQHPTAGGVGAQLSYGDGRFQHGAFRFPGLLQLLFDLFPPRPRRLLDSRLNGRYPRALYDAGRPFPIDFALGAALMVRREAIEATGLLDGAYFMYAEEVDWCWRMQRAGWQLFCVPTARVIHHAGASARQFRARSQVNLWRSRQLLYRRFYGPVRRTLAGLLVRLGMRAEARRARVAAARGEISAEELAERLEASRRVAVLFGRNR